MRDAIVKNDNMRDAVVKKTSEGSIIRMNFINKELTTDERYLVQGFPPCICDFDCFPIIFLLLGLHSLIVGMSNKVRNIVSLHSVGDVPEVSAFRQQALSSLFRHIKHELLILFKTWPELSN